MRAELKPSLPAPAAGMREAITASRHRHDEASSFGVAERLAQHPDLNLDVVFFNDEAVPCARDQFVLGDEFARLFGEHAENVQRAGAQRHFQVVAVEKTRSEVETEWSERHPHRDVI